MADGQDAIFHNVRDALVARPGGFEAYIFYLHGRIIEDGDRRPTHAKYGVYEYDQVLQALAIPDVAVISEARAAKTDAVAYAGEITSQLKWLFSSGIEPSKVTVIGFSKGGVIALMVSHLLGHDDVGFVVLAACGSWLDGGVDGDPLRLHGRMLSIHEASDPIGECRPYVEPSLPGLFFHEIEVAIGGSHGAFYQPNQDWLDQTLLWTGAPSIRSQMVRPERVEPEQGL